MPRRGGPLGRGLQTAALARRRSGRRACGTSACPRAGGRRCTSCASGRAPSRRRSRALSRRRCCRHAPLCSLPSAPSLPSPSPPSSPPARARFAGVVTARAATSGARRTRDRARGLHRLARLARLLVRHLTRGHHGTPTHPPTDTRRRRPAEARAEARRRAAVAAYTEGGRGERREGRRSSQRASRPRGAASLVYGLGRTGGSGGRGKGRVGGGEGVAQWARVGDRSRATVQWRTRRGAGCRVRRSLMCVRAPFARRALRLDPSVPDIALVVTTFSDDCARTAATQLETDSRRGLCDWPGPRPTAQLQPQT